MKPACGKSWASNFLMRSDMTLGPSFKVNLKSAYNSLIIGPRDLKCENNL